MILRNDETMNDEMRAFAQFTTLVAMLTGLIIFPAIGGAVGFCAGLFSGNRNTIHTDDIKYIAHHSEPKKTIRFHYNLV